MGKPWSEAEWARREIRICRDALTCESDEAAFASVAREARQVLKNYSTSFFLVTRFLPAFKRSQVDVIYSAVRYPDEIVDTFPLTQKDRLKLLDEWTQHYEAGLREPCLRKRVALGSPAFIAAFAEVVLQNQIPAEHYRAFLGAMRIDVCPRPYQDLEDLVESYIYGSATVVGYFLAYVYGPSAPERFLDALTASRNLAIALQLTNFLRDVGEDQRRGRIYLPVDMLLSEGIRELDASGATERDSVQKAALNRVLQTLSSVAEGHYAEAERRLNAFAPDCRTAIRACIDVYRQLNLRIGRSNLGISHRESVPMREKFRVLPPSKYWRLPLAYLGGL